MKNFKIALLIATLLSIFACLNVNKAIRNKDVINAVLQANPCVGKDSVVHSSDTTIKVDTVTQYEPYEVECLPSVDTFKQVVLLPNKNVIIYRTIHDTITNYKEDIRKITELNNQLLQVGNMVTKLQSRKSWLIEFIAMCCLSVLLVVLLLKK